MTQDVMKSAMIKIAVIGLTVALGGGVMSGCASMEPYEYHDEAESKKGPGLLTGEDGEAVLFRIPADPEEQPEDVQAEDATEAPESERMIQP